MEVLDFKEELEAVGLAAVAAAVDKAAVDQLDHLEHVAADALQLFAVQEQWATAVLRQVAAA